MNKAAFTAASTITLRQRSIAGTAYATERHRGVAPAHIESEHYRVLATQAVGPLPSPAGRRSEGSSVRHSAGSVRLFPDAAHRSRGVR